MFVADVAASRSVGLAEWRDRGVAERVTERVREMRADLVERLS